MKSIIKFFIFLFVSLTVSQAGAYSLQTHLNRALLKDISFDREGYFTNTSSNSYFIIDGFTIDKPDACVLLFDLNYKQAQIKPNLFEIYWRNAGQDFSESNKAFFIVDDNSENTKLTRYSINLCKLTKYTGNLKQLTGLKIGFPVNRTVSAKFDSMMLINKNKLSSEKPINLNVYERVALDSEQSNKRILVALKSGILAGLSRFGEDQVFLFFWLALIITVVLAVVKRK